MTRHVAVLLAAATAASYLAVRPTAAQSRAPREPAPTLDAAISRASAAAATFETGLGAVVAEEHLEQHTNTGVRRVLRSDLLLVQVNGRWLPFRDVFEVDGKAVRDRTDRLQKLFLDGSEAAMASAKRISDESSRYNLGTVVRTINVPTFPQILLRSANLRRFRFRRDGIEDVRGIACWRVRFTERRGATLVRTLSGEYVPLEGTLWIEPRSGRLLKAVVKTLGSPDPGNELLLSLQARIKETFMWVVVTYAPDDTLGIWVPQTMREWARDATGAREVTGDATYSNFRRFEVKTRETFEVPVAR